MSERDGGEGVRDDVREEKGGSGLRRRGVVRASARASARGGGAGDGSSPAELRRAGSVRLASFLTPSDHGEVSSTLRMMRAGKKTEPSSSREVAYVPRASPGGARLARPRRASVFARLRDARRSATESASLARPGRGGLHLLRRLHQVRDVVPEVADVWASEFIARDVAFCRRRSVLERGTRVNRSSSIFARASMRASSRLANALDVSPTSPPSSSGASPSSCASSCHEEEARDAVRRKEREREGERSAESARAGDGRRATTERSFPRGGEPSKNVHLLIG